MTLYAGLLAGAAMGLIVAALGAGGSIFIVPVLLYLFHEPVPVATGTALTVVSAAAAVGTLGHWRRGRVRGQVALWFGGSAVAGAALGSMLHSLVSERFAVVAFAVAMLVAAVRMGLGNPPAEESGPPVPLRLVPLGGTLGVVTGFLGVGGGFLIVPALIWGARQSLRDAVGTSLAVIASSSAAAAAGYALQGQVSPALILPVGGGAVLGALAGAPLSGKLPERPLRLMFAALSAAVGLYMLVRSLTGP